MAIKLANIHPELAVEEIGNFVITSVLEAKSSGCVIGLSGGVDSTCTAAIIKFAFDKHNLSHEEKLELVGYVLPSEVNDLTETADGIKVAKRLKIRHQLINIEPVVKAHLATNPEVFIDTAQGRFNKGNMISRARANILSTKAASEGKTLAGTGNRDEDFGIGYYTLFGDGAVHISPIGNLPKRLVRQLAVHFGFEDIAAKPSTPGLMAGVTAFREIGYSYDIVELIWEALYNNHYLPENILQDEQVLDQANREISDYESAFGIKKFPTLEAVIFNVLVRHLESAIPKSKILHPPAAPVTLFYEE